MRRRRGNAGLAPLIAAGCLAAAPVLSAPLAAAPQWVERPAASTRIGWVSATTPAKTAAPTPAQPARPSSTHRAAAPDRAIHLTWQAPRYAALWWHSWTAVPPVDDVSAGPLLLPAPAAAPQHAAPLDLPARSLAAPLPTRTPIDRPAAPAVPAPTPPPNAGLHRWLDIQTLSFATRYRRVDTTAGAVTANQLQHNEGVRVRFTLDSRGRVVIGLGAATGTSFTGGWNNAGIGTPGDVMTDIAVRQLFIAVTPVRGLEALYGGLAFTRGENTEITSWDNDGYLTGARVSVTRPDWLGADELRLTVGYLGETTTPNLFRRLDRLDDRNYWQVLVAKKTARVNWSSDLTSLDGTRTWRAGAYLKLAGARVLDALRAETYHRFAADDGAGVAITAEKTVWKTVTLGAGVADIDLQYGGLNADRFGKGRRWFATGNVTLVPELTLLTFYQHAVGNDVALTNRSRVDVILQWNALKALQRAKWY